eukprot:TRINITY_DN4826_c0_g1_i1.p4 TRINITY_DN4826_c0_g1~~TRINITY_DN4826_c0_g1_i1.p4  ORF type:complete len:160 (+),score=49.72 TRINITY_DN4826_c0_g1_i1:61-480(+)
MATDAPTMRPTATVREAAALMAARGTGAVVVTEPNTAPGLFTHANVVRRVAEGAELTTTLREVLVGHAPVTADAQMGTDDVARLMNRTRQHHVLVVDATGQWVGLVSSWDLAKEITQEAGAFPYTPEYIQALRQDFARH